MSKTRSKRRGAKITGVPALVVVMPDMVSIVLNDRAAVARYCTADSLKARLKNIRRWGFFGRQAISVWEHSCRVRDDVQARGFPIEEVCAALWHDVAEAFTGDILSPLKKLSPELRRLDLALTREIFYNLGIDPDLATHPAIKAADKRAYEQELAEMLAALKRKRWWRGFVVAFALLPLPLSSRAVSAPVSPAFAYAQRLAPAAADRPQIVNAVLRACEPDLVNTMLGIVAIESGFHVNARSATGDYGAFQINKALHDRPRGLKAQTEFACKRLAWAVARGGAGFYHSGTPALRRAYEARLRARLRAAGVS